MSLTLFGPWIQDTLHRLGGGGETGVIENIVQFQRGKHMASIEVPLGKQIFSYFLTLPSQFERALYCTWYLLRSRPFWLNHKLNKHCRTFRKCRHCLFSKVHTYSLRLLDPTLAFHSKVKKWWQRICFLKDYRPKIEHYSGTSCLAFESIFHTIHIPSSLYQIVSKKSYSHFRYALALIHTHNSVADNTKLCNRTCLYLLYRGRWGELCTNAFE